jgi:predicted DNA-binding transcriptional regulator YafY
MVRADRLLRLVLVLQTRERVTAAELASSIADTARSISRSYRQDTTMP